MNEIASPGQLRLAYLRWALVTVPVIVLLGFLSGQLANSGFGNRWFDALEKPALMPPGWAFGVAAGLGVWRCLDHPLHRHGAGAGNRAACARSQRAGHRHHPVRRPVCPEPCVHLPQIIPAH